MQKAGNVVTVLATGFDCYPQTPAAVAQTRWLFTFLLVQNRQPRTDTVFPDILTDTARRPASAILSVSFLPFSSHRIYFPERKPEGGWEQNGPMSLSLLSQRTFADTPVTRFSCISVATPPLAARGVRDVAHNGTHGHRE